MFKFLNQCFAQLRFWKSVSSKTFGESETLFQNRSCAKHWFKNLNILVDFFLQHSRKYGNWLNKRLRDFPKKHSVMKPNQKNVKNKQETESKQFKFQDSKKLKLWNNQFAKLITPLTIISKDRSAWLSLLKIFAVDSYLLHHQFWNRKSQRKTCWKNHRIFSQMLVSQR